ncbi:MAG: putative periplasmic ligand-binding sensor domain protein [Bacteroidota bacterium]|nr:putative periplasmic ligand-binding sensor domain protein [Bacteroidota bacterium]
MKINDRLKNLKCFAIVFAMMLCFPIKAQQIKFNNISILQGLSQSTVNCVIQDREGFMWIGTQDGLNKFDGYSFKVFKHDPKITSSISDNYIQTLCEDRSGNIWIGTYGSGLCRLNKLSGKFETFKNDSSNKGSISNDAVTSIVCDSKDNLWIGTQDGLNYYDQKAKQFRCYRNSSQDLNSISSNKVSCVFIDNRERLWVGTDQGFNLMNTGGRGFTRFSNDPLNNNSLSKNIVKMITQDHQGMIWIATSGGGADMFNPVNFEFRHFVAGKNSLNSNDVWVIFEDLNFNMWFGSYGDGLCRYDRKSEEFTVYKNSPSDNNSLSHNVIMCAYQDYRGLYWVGTLGGGLNVFDPVKESFRHFRHEQSNVNTLSENVVMGFWEDPDQTVWIGTYGGGLNKFNPKTNEFIYFRKKENDKRSLASDIVRCIFRDSKGRLWIGTYGGGLNLMQSNGSFTSYRHDENDANSISSDDVWCIREDKDGSVWIGTWGGGLNHFYPEENIFRSYKSDPSKSNSISNNKVISLSVDADNKVWAGTNGGGLELYDRSVDGFTHFKSNTEDSTTLSSDRIRSILPDGNFLWIGTDGGGLNKMNVHTKKVIQFSEKNGLPNNVVYGIVKDEKGNIWLSTNNGLSKLNPSTNAFQNFDVKDGLQSNEFNQGAYLKTKDDKIYFGGVNGFNIFKPASIRKNPNRPPVFITSIKLFNNELPGDTTISYRKKLDLDYTDNFLSFEFAALDYTASEKNQYACKMEGFDKDWIKLGNRRYVSYTNLDPGKYIFRIKASNNDGVWNEQGNSLIIVISPPFWKTIWFYVIMILLILAGIYIYTTFRTRKLKRDKLILEKEVQSRTFEVVQQKDIIEKKNKDITDSINYARRIQQAILPSNETIKRYFPSSFVLYKPKDIVSGDFYWMETNGKKNFVAAVDCTGHGVPGAFMSIVGYNLLNQALNEHGIDKPSVILNGMNRGLSKQLRQHVDEITVRDGMDLALCAFDFENNKLQYAGANNPLWVLRNNEMIKIKADKQPIGTFSEMESKPFTNHEIDLQSGDQIFLFSDGFADQFGGPDGKKFKYRSLEALLLKLAALPMEEQKKRLDTAIEEWRGNLEQVDDILVIGIRV